MRESWMNPEEEPLVRAEKLLAVMSLEEKMGQLSGFYPGAKWSEEELKREHPHGAGQVACFGMREMKTVEEAANYQRELQAAVMELTGHRIPAIFHMEGLCGLLIRDARSFPSGIGRGATWDPELERQVGEIIGTQAAALGTAQVLAPVLDVARDARFGRQGESYGEDAALVSAMGVGYMKGLQKKGSCGSLRVWSAAKHFAGYHDSQGGIHAANCDIPERLFREVYTKPFQAAITEAGLHGIMPCYSAVNGIPVSGSEEILQGILREEMGFEGVVVSDYHAVDEIHGRQKAAESVTAAGAMALAAGVDMELPSKVAYNEELMEWFCTGRLPQEILDCAVLHILTEKFRMGLFEQPFAQMGETLRRPFQNPAGAEVSLKAARESMVLLKNDGILPLKKTAAKIAVIGYHAAATRALFGGYTYMCMTERWLGAKNTMAGVVEDEVTEAGVTKRGTTEAGIMGDGVTEAEGLKDEADVDVRRYSGSYTQKEHPLSEKLAKHLYPFANNLLEELRKRLPDSPIGYAYGCPYAGDDQSGFEEAVCLAEQSDIIVMTVGKKYGTGSMASTGEGIDSTSVNLPPCQESLIEVLGKLGKPIILVHFDGRPISSDNAERYASAILEAWNPAEAGARAVADVLLGEYNPGGRLPVSAAYNAGQVPVYYNHHNGSSSHQGCIGAYTSYMDCPFEPRYAFGYGLSYTAFSYEELEIAHVEGESALISFSVRNVGEADGEEVVQCYIQDVYATVTRPVMELAGFARVPLKVGEEARVTFTVKESQMAFLDRRMKWKVEKGSYRVLVGAASNDIRLEGEFTVKEDRYVDGRTRGFYAGAEVKITA